METIKKFLDDDEEILWHKTISPKSSNERVYVVTNKRCYKKFHKVANKDYSGAPKEYLRVVDDILIVERKGIKIVKFSHWVSCILKGEDPGRKPYLVFERVFRNEGEMLKNLLLDTSNLASEWGVDHTQYMPMIQQSGSEDWVTPDFQQYPVSGPPPDIANVTEVSQVTGTCAFCKINLTEIQGKTYTCSACGAYYHGACLDNVMREGFCTNCNKTLLW